MIDLKVPFVILRIRWNRFVSAFNNNCEGDEMFSKAAVIGALTIVVVAFIALAALAASSMNKGAGWFK